MKRVYRMLFIQKATHIKQELAIKNLSIAISSKKDSALVNILEAWRFSVSNQSIQFLELEIMNTIIYIYI